MSDQKLSVLEFCRLVGIEMSPEEAALYELVESAVDDGRPLMIDGVATTSGRSYELRRIANDRPNGVYVLKVER